MLIVNTEEVFNKYGDLVKLIYHYEDGSMGEKDLFISAKELARLHKQLEDNCGIPQYKSGDNTKLNENS